MFGDNQMFAGNNDDPQEGAPDALHTEPDPNQPD